MEENGASDLHLTVGLSPYIRIKGKIFPTNLPKLSEKECESMLFAIITEDQKEQFKKQKVIDCSYGEKDVGRFRINIYKQRGTITAAIRRLPVKIPGLEELGLPVRIIQMFCDMPNGLVLVAGPTGCGKTTSMASMAHYINMRRSGHIISIEDPIEYIHSNTEGKGIVHQIEIHTDSLSFADALKYGLREDPDVMLIGEMRDLETIASAVTIAETGHLVLATLHTSTAGESISRIVDVFPAQKQAQVRVQLSFSLVGVIHQQLLPTVENKNRVLATEIMISTPAISSLIRENKLEGIYSHMQIGAKFGMKTMNQSLYELVKRNAIDKRVAMGSSPRPKELDNMLKEDL